MKCIQCLRIQIIKLIKPAYLFYNAGFKGQQCFAIPGDAKLTITEAQKTSLNLKRLVGTVIFIPSVDNQYTYDCSYSINGDQESVRELYSILNNSKLSIVYTANGNHERVKNADSLIQLIIR